mgnify:CR=1 FL=1|tara:strand:+ start:648 stop:1265 length:618 start_codon:yes stop_codon:yes gene_type:complete
MQLIDQCRVYPRAIPERICKYIIDEGLQTRPIKGETGLSADTKQSPFLNKNKSFKKIRDSKVSFFKDHRWINILINPYIFDANKQSQWNFDISDNESFQFTKYDVSEHYDWHQDCFKDSFPQGHEYAGLYRKLSFSLVLSDKKKYKGGDLCFSYIDNQMKKKEIKHNLEIGTLVVFPSFVWHKVEPITKGTRFSLVGWYLGDKFK